MGNSAARQQQDTVKPCPLQTRRTGCCTAVNAYQVDLSISTTSRARGLFSCLLGAAVTKVRNWRALPLGTMADLTTADVIAVGASDAPIALYIASTSPALYTVSASAASASSHRHALPARPSRPRSLAAVPAASGLSIRRPGCSLSSCLRPQRHRQPPSPLPPPRPV